MQNQKKKREKNLAYQSQKNAIKLIKFFTSFTTEEIQENNEKFKFWTRILLEKEEFNDLDFRKEFLRIGDMMQALNDLVDEIPQPQVESTLKNLSKFLKLTERVLIEEFGKEAIHV